MRTIDHAGTRMAHSLVASRESEVSIWRRSRTGQVEQENERQVIFARSRLTALGTTRSQKPRVCFLGPRPI